MMNKYERSDRRIPRFSSLRWLMSVGLVAATVTAVDAQTLPKPGEEPVVVFGGFGGSVRDQMYEGCFTKFTQLTGIKVDYIESSRLGPLKAQVDSGKPEMDVTWVNGIEMPKAIAGNLLEPVAYDMIDKALLTPNQYDHPFGKYGVAFDVFTEAMAYNTKKWPADKRPKSWADFWDVKNFPGPRGMDGRTPLNGAFEAASRALGVPAAKTYPIDLDKVFAKLDEIKPHVTVWHKTGAEQVKAMVREEVDMILAFSGRIVEARAAGASFEVVPETYIRTNGSLFVIPRGAKHPKNASLVMGYCARAETMAYFSMKRAGAPSNLKALDLMDKSFVPSNHPSLKETTVVVDDEWYGNQLDALNKRWTDWITRR
ncbi:MAG: extracellular solute-binding protein [Alphaproteobacteria bacterium]|nr:extracellular solute-binding protein [Alphaproteobacteria bacterium]